MVIVQYRHRYYNNATSPIEIIIIMISKKNISDPNDMLKKRRSSPLHKCELIIDLEYGTTYYMVRHYCF